MPQIELLWQNASLNHFQKYRILLKSYQRQNAITKIIKLEIATLNKEPSNLYDKLLKRFIKPKDIAKLKKAIQYFFSVRIWRSINQ